MKRSVLRAGLYCGTAVLLLLVVFACAGGEYGRLRPSSSVSDMFVKGPLDRGYEYYYSGPINKPWAIIGIASGYTLETKRWKPVSPDSGQIAVMMDALTGYKGFALQDSGSDILDPAGNRIGVWYSKKAEFTTVKMLGDHVVAVYPPSPREERGPALMGQ